MNKFLTFYHYKIVGFNLNYIINSLKRRGVFVYNLKKVDKKTLLLTISAVNEKKLFAITNGLCYNVIKIGENGFFTTLSFIKKRLSLFLGIIFFLTAVILFNNFLIKIEVVGSGSSKKEEIKGLLGSVGVKEYSFFLKKESDIKKELLSTGDFSFCSVEKRGNRLIIEVALAKEEKENLKSYSLIAPITGQIVSLKVYKGTAVKNVGDNVSLGEEIVAGFETVLEEPVKTPVFAEAKIEYLKQTQFCFTKEVSEEFLLHLVKEESSFDAKIESVSFNNLDEKYVYTVEYKGYLTVTVGG